MFLTKKNVFLLGAIQCGQLVSHHTFLKKCDRNSIKTVKLEKIIDDKPPHYLTRMRVNPSHSEATFVQITRMQRISAKGFSHFSAFLHHFVLTKLATSSKKG